MKDGFTVGVCLSLRPGFMTPLFAERIAGLRIVAARLARA
jgi:hypothetical protein